MEYNVGDIIQTDNGEVCVLECGVKFEFISSGHYFLVSGNTFIFQKRDGRVFLWPSECEINGIDYGIIFDTMVIPVGLCERNEE